MAPDDTTIVDRVNDLLAPCVAQIQREHPAWSASGGMLFSGRWRATNEPVIIKIGVNPNQLYWTRQMAAACPDLLPSLFASGEVLDTLPIGWTVMERIAHGPLGPAWQGYEFPMVLDAAIEFQRAARKVEPRQIATMDLDRLRQWLEVGQSRACPGPTRVVWQRLEDDFAWVTSVCASEICHGDAHLANALSRTPPPNRGTAVLIDCQPIVQPWAFEAAYLQVLNSIDRSRVGYTGLVSLMARLREERGMPACAPGNRERLARICLAWQAIRLWGICRDRWSIADYRWETERYVTDGARVGDYYRGRPTNNQGRSHRGHPR